MSVRPASFRADVQGLRAIAVLAVMFYHFKLPFVSGGFVGVDVFFVISGYLMTQIIMQNVALKRFSLLSFYAARVRRIVPALVVVVLTVLAFGWANVLPADYDTMGRNASNTLMFAVNFSFMENDDYFSPAAEKNWFLHAWSLAVEWQFYLLFPFVVWALMRWRQGRALAGGLVLLALASLLMCLWLVQINPLAAYYSLPTRAWQLLAGALVFVYGQKIKSPSPYMHPLGLLLVLASLFLVSAKSYPNIQAILPVLGACLLLLPLPQLSLHAANGRKQWLAGVKAVCVIYANHYSVHLLSHPWAQFVGNISYSLYLWHWPVAVWASFWGIQRGSWLAVLAMFAASFILATLSYFGVEKPCRQRSRRIMLFILLAWLVSLAAALVVTKNDGLPQRMPQPVQVFVQQIKQLHYDKIMPRACKNWKRPADGKTAHICTIDANVSAASTGLPKILVLGDSHAEHLYPVLASVAKQTSQTFLLAGAGNCSVPVQGLNFKTGYHCDNFTQQVLQRALQPDVTTVVYSARWNEIIDSADEETDYRRKICSAGHRCYYQPITRTQIISYVQHQLVADIKHLQAAGKKVVILLPEPEYPEGVPDFLAYHLWRGAPLPLISQRQHHRSVQQTHRLLKQIADQTGATLYDKSDYLCPQGRCIYTQNNIALYSDENHLTSIGSGHLQSLFIKITQQ